MKLISWNVNGIRACREKGLFDFIQQEQADVFCFQEIKIQEQALQDFLKDFPLPDYSFYWNLAQKNGYSGVLMACKTKPLRTWNDLAVQELDNEGRVQTIELKDFFLINAYFPNAQRELVRLDFKEQFNQAFLENILELEKKKPVIFTGDLNVAHEEIDLANPKQNRKNAGFSDEERRWMSTFLANGYKDSFREKTPEGGHYSWWSYRNKARERNIGWRLDYFVVSQNLWNRVEQSEICTQVLGSDHCPIRLTLQDGRT